MAYTTLEEVTAYVSEDHYLPTDVNRLIARADETIDYYTHHRFPYYEPIMTPEELSFYKGLMKNATCAQIEYWLEMGERIGIAGGDAMKDYKTKDLSVSGVYQTLAPRARMQLMRTGWLNRRVRMGRTSLLDHFKSNGELL